MASMRRSAAAAASSLSTMNPVMPSSTSSGTEPQFRLVTLVSPYVRSENVWYCPSVGPDYVVEQLSEAERRFGMRISAKGGAGHLGSVLNCGNQSKPGRDEA